MTAKPRIKTSRRGTIARGSAKPVIVRVGQGLPNLGALREELQGMTDILLDRDDPPIDVGVMTLMEVATAFYARAAEITAILQKAEANGVVTRGSKHYKFRTGELRTFMDMASKKIDLGSRRVTAAKMEYDMSHEAM